MTIHTRDLTRSFGSKDVLTGVDLEIMPGAFVTIQGPTGGGKSTLLQLLGALDTPTSGEVFIGDVGKRIGVR